MSQIQDEEDRLFKVYQYGLGVSNAILMPISVYLIFFSREIVFILLGNDWNETIIPLQIMFVVLPFSISGRMADSVIRAKGYIYKNVVRKYVYVLVLLFSVSTGAYFWGLKGAAIGVTGSYLINYVIMVYLVMKIFKKSFLEIFLEPLKEAVILSVAASTIFIIYNIIFNQWDSYSIIYYLVFSILLVTTVFIIALKKPSLFGVYLGTVIRSVLKKNKKL